MPWTIYAVPGARRAELDEILHDDLVARQSQKIRDATALGGPSGELYVLIDGVADVVAAAEQRLAKIGKKPLNAEELRQRFSDEDESAAAGMGLFFTE